MLCLCLSNRFVFNHLSCWLFIRGAPFSERSQHWFRYDIFYRCTESLVGRSIFDSGGVFFVPSLLPIWFVVCSYIYCDFYYKLIRSRKLFCSTWISSISFFNISCHKRFCIFACCALCFSCWFFRYVFFLSLSCVFFCCAPFLDYWQQQQQHHIKTFQSQFWLCAEQKTLILWISYKSKWGKTHNRLSIVYKAHTPNPKSKFVYACIRMVWSMSCWFLIQ